MTGRRIAINDVIVKDGKLVRVTKYRSASAAIAAKKSKKQKVVRRVPNEG